jgi:membrane-associated phospholipid phosphatase
MFKINRNRILLVAYYLFLLLGLLFVFILKKDNSFLLINRYHNGLMNFIMPWISILGDGLFIVIFSLVLGFYRLRWFFLSIIPYLLSGIAAQVLKRFVFSEMSRPLKYFSDKGLEIFTVPGLDIHLSHSFPSGHTTSAFALFFVLALLSNKQFYKLIFLFLAVLVGYSRIYLAQHFPVDVMAGSLIGVLSVMISFPVIMGWRKRWLDFSVFSLIYKSNAD